MEDEMPVLKSLTFTTIPTPGGNPTLDRQKPNVRLPRSQILNEMGVVSQNRDGGLSAAEAAQILADVNNL